jgi:hypothetical protein
MGKQRGPRDDRPGRERQLRPAVFYETLDRERIARGWRVRQFSEHLGLGDLLYKWRTRKPTGLPEAETLIQIAIRLEWSLDRLLKGVSSAYDAQADARGKTVVTPAAENVTPRLVVSPEPQRRVVFENGETIEVVRLQEWVALKFIHALTSAEVAAVRPLLLDWLNERERRAGNPMHTQAPGDDSTGTNHPHRRRDDR